MALRIVASRPDPAIVTLPWSTPLEEWSDDYVVPLPRGLSRHVVRIVRLKGRVYAVKETVEEELAVTERERETFLAELRSRGLLAEGAGEEETVAALHELLTRSPSRLLGVAVSDLVGDRRTQNQPGTHREYPNWRVPLSGPDGTPLLLDDLAASTRAQALAATLNQP